MLRAVGRVSPVRGFVYEPGPLGPGGVEGIADGLMSLIGILSLVVVLLIAVYRITETVMGIWSIREVGRDRVTPAEFAAFVVFTAGICLGIPWPNFWTTVVVPVVGTVMLVWVIWKFGE